MASKATKRLCNKSAEAFQFIQFKVTIKGSNSGQIKWKNTMSDSLYIK